MSLTSPKHLLFLVLIAATPLAGGCTISATPATFSVAPAAQVHVVQHAPPTRVYHSGQWLYYRSDGYYYRTGTSWHAARAVPTHVHRYHRPVHVQSRPTHVHSGPTHVYRSGPTHVRTSSPTHVRSSRSTQVRSSRPVHSGRTVTHTRRTYRR